ncbi:TetR family transcriptional regulator [Saccharopolyspora erythraea NRRL 2338]|uniref:TetR/AcrR family transcriptional regulator n=1 Tax=Saccharopolyspora erythraea TaxID=1836 RepID=A0ABN1D9M3_SACER|nr:TetR/AcrR family transcriptional regulator [Saccharopolyspora erythraea]PFG94366.1 TetR family transcriptional regulator [Saccharopolyspora erythraea NRRL 2338]QRK91136.1 WHG domain-containing protein [Saccharopolyspora erythraea]
MAAISYHHGDLRRTILDAAAAAIAESGPASWSLRELARRAGVSHAAPAHHFGDKTGLLTDLAAEGFGLLADALADAGDDFVDVGLAYVRFAVDHRAHFEVMFQPDLYRTDDPRVTAARDRAGHVLEEGVRQVQGEHERTTELAAWSLVHGFASLWISGALSESANGDPEASARPVLRRLFEQ